MTLIRRCRRVRSAAEPNGRSSEADELRLAGRYLNQQPVILAGRLRRRVTLPDHYVSRRQSLDVNVLELNYAISG